MSDQFNVKVVFAPSPLKNVPVSTADTIAKAFADAGYTDISGSSVSVTSPAGDTVEVGDINLTFGELDVQEDSLIEAAKAIDGGASYNVKVLCAPSPLKNVPVTDSLTIASAFAAAGFTIEGSSVSVTSPAGDTREVADVNLTFGELSIEEDSLLEAARAIDGGFNVRVMSAPSPLKNVEVTSDATLASAFAQAGISPEGSAVSVTSPAGDTIEIDDLGLTFGELEIREASLIEAARQIDGGRS